MNYWGWVLMILFSVANGLLLAAFGIFVVNKPVKAISLMIVMSFLEAMFLHAVGL